MTTPLDPAAQALLDAAAAGGLPPVYRVSIDEARTRMHRGFTSGEPEPIAEMRDFTVSSSDGPVGVRLYHPEPTTALPLVVFFHGGGWTVNDLDTHDRICSVLAKEASVAVVSVDYRLSPEYRYPAAIDDAETAYRWLSTHAAELGADASRIAVAGDSSGATVAVALALRIRDSGGAPPRFQLLFYPVTDYLEPETRSYIERGAGYSLSKPFMEWAWKNYLPSDWSRDDPYLFPLRADLAGLPPALVMTAEYDPLRDEGVAFARALETAGVPVEHVHADDQMHGFVMQTRAIPRAGELVSLAAAALRRSLTS